MALATHEFINGLFSLIFVSVSIMVGLIIASRFFKYRDRNLLLVGISWCGMCEPWWSVSINFLLVLTTGQSLTQEIYIIIGYAFIFIILEMWMIAFTNLKYKDKKLTKMVLIITFAIIGVLYEILFIYFFFNDIAMIGVLQGPVDVKYGRFMMLSLLSVILMVFITGNIFSRASMKSDNPEIKLKGKFLFAAFNFYVIGSIFSVFSSYSIIFLIIARTMTIIASLAFYCGFILPNWIKEKILGDI